MALSDGIEEELMADMLECVEGVMTLDLEGGEGDEGLLSESYLAVRGVNFMS